MNPLTANRYTYVANNSVNFSDPSGYGKAGVVIRVLREVVVRGKRHFMPTRAVSMREAQEIRRAEGNVQVFGEPAKVRALTAEQVERGASLEGDILHHGPHGDSPIFRPHFQTDGYDGHTFYGFVAPLAAGSKILKHFTASHYTKDWPGLLQHAGNLVDLLNPVSDVKDVLEFVLEVIE